MGQNIIERIQAKLELFRLEQRYTRRRNRRSTFVSNAVYVDGEYIYQTPNTTGSSTGSSQPRIDALHGEKAVAAPTVTPAPLTTMVSDMPPTNRKRLQRFSSMPGFGGTFSNNQFDTKEVQPHVVERRTSMIR